MSEETVEPQGPFSRFRLIRSVDVTGISGTGEIAYGVQFPNQSCVLYWIKQGTLGIYHSINEIREIHCYSNNARVEWVD